MVAKSLSNCSGVEGGGGGGANNNKAEGDNKSSAGNRQLGESCANLAVAMNAGPTTQASGSSSGGSITRSYLFNESTDGLLDLDLGLTHSHYYSVAPNTQHQRIDIGNSNNTPPAASDTSTYRHRSTSAEKRFSIESNSSSSRESLGDDNNYNNRGSRKHNRKPPVNSSSSSSSSSSSAYRRPPIQWNQFRKSTERRAAGLARSLANSLETMATKRYYFLLLVFSLVIITCLLASIVISRSVGLEEEVAQSDSSSRAALTAAARSFNEPIIEYEQRTIDVVDLIECGKTFAYTKVRLQVRVPKSSPIYRQQPSILLSQQQKPTNGSSAPKPSGESIPPATDPVISSEPEVKFVLIDPNDFSEAETTSTTTSRREQQLLAATTSSTIIDVKPENLSRPVRVPLDGSPTTDSLSELRVLSEAKSSEQGDDRLTAAASELLLSTGDDTDPLAGLASDLNLSASELNRTLIDCFLVDTDKRFKQKTMLEDRHKSAASTRKVSVKKMIDIIVECRKLTWSSLPSTLPIKLESSEPRTLAIAASEQHQKSTTTEGAPILAANGLQPNMFASLFEDWFRATKSPLTSAENKDKLDANGSSTRRRTTRQATMRPTKIPDNRAQTQADQSSYLNMGLSMMSGIVPNTLWCGLGDRASNYSELGIEYKVDSCCRAHDHCPIRMKPFSADYGLVNWSMSTRSHCDCDYDFENCLQNVNTTLSNVIRNLYFRFVGVQCIDVEGRRMNNKLGM